jgi:hypothetical protein
MSGSEAYYLSKITGGDYSTASRFAKMKERLAKIDRISCAEVSSVI